jgi:hypothetical protein
MRSIFKSNKIKISNLSSDLVFLDTKYHKLKEVVLATDECADEMLVKTLRIAMQEVVRNINATKDKLVNELVMKQILYN